jgi:kinesin family protein 18/19
VSHLVRVSYLEIYNETIRDLLTSEDRTLDLREDGKQGQVIAGISEVEVSSTAEILTLLKVHAYPLTNRSAIEIEQRSPHSQTSIQPARMPSFKCN